MVDDLQTTLEAYFVSWQKLAQSQQNADYFTMLKPTAAGWKFTNRTELMERFAEVRDLCDQIHFGWINERWVICIHLKDTVLPGGITVVKLMERRPGSTDAIGLDHVDFLAPATDIKEMVSAENNLEWTEEVNGDHCKWISVWFEGGEAKLRTDTVLQVCANELLEIQKEVVTTT